MRRKSHDSPIFNFPVTFAQGLRGYDIVMYVFYFLLRDAYA